MNWNELKPSALFLGKFLGTYLLLNILYGVWVTSFNPKPDVVTIWATHQATFILDVLGNNVSNITHHTKPAERILLGERPVLSVYEGCNGINVWIVFFSFMIATGLSRKGLLFILAGTAIIHVSNLLRIILLFFISLHYPNSLYFFHKYFFTAVLYLVVFGMWFYWIKKNGKRTASEV